MEEAATPHPAAASAGFLAGLGADALKVARPQTAALGIVRAPPGSGLPLSLHRIRPPFDRRPPGLGEHEPGFPYPHDAGGGA